MAEEKSQNGGHVLAGLFLLLLGIVYTAVYLPLFLENGFGEKIDSLYVIYNYVKDTVWITYLDKGWLILPFVFFVFSALALLFRISASSFMLKIGALAGMFIPAFYGFSEVLDLFKVNEDTCNKIVDFVNTNFGTLSKVLLIAALVCFAFGFIFKFTSEKRNPRRGTWYQFYKCAFWIFYTAVFMTSEKLINISFLSGDKVVAFYTYAQAYYMLIGAIFAFGGATKRT